VDVDVWNVSDIPLVRQKFLSYIQIRELQLLSCAP
jgi:hypothetical protein